MRARINYILLWRLQLGKFKSAILSSPYSEIKYYFIHHYMSSVYFILLPAHVTGDIVEISAWPSVIEALITRLIWLLLTREFRVYF